MTACTNNGGKARRVVTAALVGVLSVGAVPAIALATGADVSLMFAPGGEGGMELEKGTAKPTFMADKDGDLSYTDSISCDENEDGVWEVAASDDMPYLVSVDKIKVAGTNDEVDINDSNFKDYRVRVYRADEDGNATGAALSGNKVDDAGEYVITVTGLAGSPYAGQTFKSNFVVKGIDLPQVVAFENGEKADMTFIYTGSALDVDFKTANSPYDVLEEGKDYTVTYTKGGKAVDSVTDAGTYVATLKGEGKYAGSETSCPVEVGRFKIDVSTDIVIAPFEESPDATPVSVSREDAGANGSKFTTFLDPSLVSVAPTTSTSTPGTYQFKVTTPDGANIQIGGQVANATKTWPGRKVENIATFTYKNASLEDSYELDASKGEEFDVSDIEAFNGKTEIADTEVSVDVDYDKKVEDGSVTYSGNAEADIEAGLPGVYKLVVTADDEDGNDYAGAATVTVTIYKGSLDADTSVFVYPPVAPGEDPVAVTSYEKGYDGVPLEANDFEVTFNGKEPDDFTVELLKGDEVVDEAVDAGEYTLVVTSSWYKLSGTTEMPVTISKVDLTKLEIGAIEKWNGVAGENYLPAKANGYDVSTSTSAISSLELVYGDEALPDVVDVVVEINDEGTWKEVGTVGLDDDGDTLIGGQYRLTATVPEDIASNFILPEGATSVTVPFTVSLGGSFKDVQPSDWYFEPVEKALVAGYMNGTTAPEPVYDNTSHQVGYVPQSGTFSPLSELTRGEVACVLYNVSGAHVDETDKSYNEHIGWLTGFSDVDGKQFYAEAIYWAKQNGVINGYGDGTFQPLRKITREEFACMLANFAEKVLRDEDVAKDNSAALAEMPDADSVTEWAEQGVAWAVSKKVMGNDGRVSPTALMNRGTCASMVVNYMLPEA
ncbi:S-layer homology domain-containing protein [Olsenella sp. An293]|uniref:S-layer homology domain-containing protein n=1 Tax=Olsenella sp. An293 TaxID=1965626 RepID=UPI001180FF12|nr:S-layer homology domain-containing protein [Olsenella sp. An293]